MNGEYQAMIRQNDEVFVRRLYPDEDWRTILVAHADHEFTITENASRHLGI